MAVPRSAEELDVQIFDFVRESEEAIVEAGRKWASAVGDSLPVEMPVTHELMKGFFDFTEEVLRIQREFARELIMEWRRLLARTAETTRARPRSTRTRTTRAPRKSVPTRTTKAA
jgi:hypothetical protein